MRLLALLGLMALAMGNPINNPYATFCRVASQLSETDMTAEAFIIAVSPLIRDVCGSVGVKFTADQFVATALKKTGESKPEAHSYESCMKYKPSSEKLIRDCRVVIKE